MSRFVSSFNSGEIILQFFILNLVVGASTPQKLTNKLKMKFNYLFIIFFGVLFGCKQSNEDILNEALRLQRSGKNSEAIRLYDKILSRNARLQVVYYNRGLVYREQKRYSDALNDFNTIIELKGSGPVIIEINEKFRDNSEESRSEIPYSDALYQRAQTKYLMDSLKSSFLDFQYLIDNDYEERSNCLLWQGDIYIRSGKKEKGCLMFQKAREIATNNEDVKEANRMMAENCK